MSKQFFWVYIVIILMLAGVVKREITYATCNDGTPGSEEIICDTTNLNLEGLAGDDTITVTTGTIMNGYIAGDGAGGGIPLNALGGSDVITNNGTVLIILGDDVFNNNGGSDVITNNGTVVANVIGDNALVSGNGGADTIINNGSVGGDILGDGVLGVGGNDLIIIRVGSTVGGNIDGQGGNDTIQFTNVDATAQAIISACTNLALCDITIGANTYRIRNFETLQMVLLAIAQEEELFSSAPLVPQEFCTGVVKAFRLLNGDIEVYSGFDHFPPNGFLVGIIPNGRIGRFSNNDRGWSVTAETDEKLRVFDNLGNLVSDTCKR